MKKLILTLFTVIAFINVQAQCTSNPIRNHGAEAEQLYFSDSSTVSPNFSTNYSVSYFWNFGDGTTSTQQSPCHTYGDLSNVTFSIVCYFVCNISRFYNFQLLSGYRFSWGYHFS